MALFKCIKRMTLQVFLWKTSLGGIRKSLAQQIFPRLRYLNAFENEEVHRGSITHHAIGC